MKNGSSEPKIEKGVPLPAAKGGTGVTKTLRRMKVGDSFLSDRKIEGIHQIAYQIGIKVSVRKMPEGIRVWRTK